MKTAFIASAIARSWRRNDKNTQRSGSRSRRAACAALVAIAASSVLGQTACSSPAGEEVASTQQAVFGVDDVIAVYATATAAYEAYTKLTGYIQAISGTTPNPNQQVIDAIAGLSSQMTKLQSGLNQVDDDLRGLVVAELQSDWDRRVSTANGAKAQADTASSELAQWLASGRSNAGLLLQADNNSINAANLIKDDPTLFSRPTGNASQPNEVFEYRMALPQYLYALTVRMGVIATEHPQLGTEADATAGPVRAELASHAARLSAVLGQLESEITAASWQRGRYESASAMYLACSVCTDPLSGDFMQAGGTVDNLTSPACETWLNGTTGDMARTVQRDALFNKGRVYSDIGLLAAVGLRDLVVATSQPGLFGPAGQFLYPTPGTSYGFYGSHGNLVGDVDGDGYADVVGLGDGYVGVNRNIGKPNATPTGYETWWGGSFYGSHGTFLADVDGDKRADLVGVGDGYVGVLLSTGTGFGAYQTWSTDPSATGQSGGWHGSLVGDVNGDGKADLVTLLDQQVIVSYSNGASFNGALLGWQGGFYGSHGTYLGDVDGDGHMDLIGLGDGYVGVIRWSGGFFNQYETWWGGSFYGAFAGVNDMTFVGDVDGDGRADVVALGTGQVDVIRSNGTTFGPSETWWGNDNGGSPHGNGLSDVDGDGRADLVGFGNTGVTWQKSARQY